MNVTTPPKTYTITVDEAERDLMSCALRGLAARHREAIARDEKAIEQGVHVAFTDELRMELASVERMHRDLRDADLNIDTA